jgi:CotS family spore coat protein
MSAIIRAEVNVDPAAIKSLIMEHYRLPVVSLHKVRAIYQINTPYGLFGFKNGEELPDLALVADCLDRIRHNGFDRTPEFVLTHQGKYLVSHENQSYFMEKWVDYPEVPKMSFPYLQPIGSALADFHRSAKGIMPPRASHRFEWGKREGLLRTDLTKIREWIQSRSNTATEKRILDFLHYRCHLALEYVRRVSPQMLLITCPDAAVLCHGGLHHKNILIDPQQRIWFIDFETLVYAERVMDLAQLLQYHAGAYHWNPTVVNTFLSAYLSRIRSAIGPEEWSLFFSYLAFPRRFHNRMIRYFGNREHPEPYLLKLQETVDQELDKEQYLNHPRKNAALPFD